jgi:glyoxylase-like metal-dependent hydrolase (beta-lactamase superfamily II)
MNNDSFRFNLGTYRCIVIRDTIWDMELNSTYPEITCERFEQLFNHFKMQPIDKFEVNCLFLKNEKYNILIDSGWGNSRQANTGTLLQNLINEGIQPQEIDFVIHTHGHPDHIGGNTNLDGVPNFPNAKYILSENEWNFWNTNPKLEEAGDKKETILACLKKNLFDIKDRFEIVKTDFDFIPGLRYINAPGHTPGHAVCQIISDSDQLICTGDVYHHPFGISFPDWRMPMDFSTEQAINTRIRIREKAVSTNAMVFGCHLPFPCLGQVEKHDNEYIWKPV